MTEKDEYMGGSNLTRVEATATHFSSGEPSVRIWSKSIWKSNPKSTFKPTPFVETRIVTISPSLWRSWVHTQKPVWFVGSGCYPNEELEEMKQEEMGKTELDKDEFDGGSDLRWRPMVSDHHRPAESRLEQGLSQLFFGPVYLAFDSLRLLYN